MNCMSCLALANNTKLHVCYMIMLKVCIFSTFMRSTANDVDDETRGLPHARNNISTELCTCGPSPIFFKGKDTETLKVSVNKVEVGNIMRLGDTHGSVKISLEKVVLAQRISNWLLKCGLEEDMKL